MTDDLKAAAVQLARDNGAPHDVGDYMWIPVEHGGEALTGVQMAGSGDAYVPLEVTKVSTYGTLRVGWHVEARLGYWSLEPGSP